jgi:hypothetical protein
MEINLWSSGANLFVIKLVIIFAKQWVRLISLKSVTF